MKREKGGSEKGEREEKGGRKGREEKKRGWPHVLPLL